VHRRPPNLLGASYRVDVTVEDLAAASWLVAVSSVPRIGADCVGLRDGTETSSMLRRWSSARRIVWTHVAFGRFLYSVWDCETLCLCCVCEWH